MPLAGGGRGDELRAHGQHREDERDEGGIRAVFFSGWQGPEVLVVGVEGLAVQHGIHGIDAFEVALEEDVGLEFFGQHGDYFWEAALTRPVVCEGVFGADAEDVGGGGVGVGNVGEETGG